MWSGKRRRSGSGTGPVLGSGESVKDEMSKSQRVCEASRTLSSQELRSDQVLVPVTGLDQTHTWTLVFGLLWSHDFLLLVLL